jgi:hypothetical protein
MFTDGVPSSFLRGAFFGIGYKHLDPASDGAKIRLSESGGFEQDHSWPLDPSTDAFYLWSSVLSEYTNCLLTKNSDKLIAISAIARQFQPILNDEYVAGLWKRYIGQHLLWQMLTPQKDTAPLTGPELHAPPSWSWASVVGKVDPYSGLVRHDKPLMIKVLEVKVDNLTADTMGPVTGGSIKVRGWLQHFPPPKLEKDEDEDDDEGLWKFEMPGDCFVAAQPDQVPFPKADKWYLLPVLECTQKNIDRKMEKKIIGLMLLETGKENEYRRIGRFDTLGKEALKFLTRPTYPFEETSKGDGGDNLPVGKIDSKKKWGWSFQKNPWVESVMNIV